MMWAMWFFCSISSDRSIFKYCLPFIMSKSSGAMTVGVGTAAMTPKLVSHSVMGRCTTS